MKKPTVYIVALLACVGIFLIYAVIETWWWGFTNDNFIWSNNSNVEGNNWIK